jgi:hypothetical protein
MLPLFLEIHPVLLDESFLALAADRRDHRRHKGDNSDNEDYAADRSHDEYRGIALGHQQGAAEISLHHWAEDQRQQHRRRFAFKLGEEVAEEAEQGQKIDVELTRMFRYFLLDRIGGKGGQQGASPRQNPEAGTEQRSPEDRCNHPSIG